MAENPYYRYYIYSRTQEQEQSKVYRETHTTDIKLKKVVVNGNARSFTEELTDMKNCRYSDAIIIAEGDKRYITVVSE